MVITREPKLGDIIDPEDDAVARLTSECMRRVCAQLHRNGSYVHRINPRTKRVCCFARDAEVPDGFVPSAAQQALWDARERKED